MVKAPAFMMMEVNMKVNGVKICMMVEANLWINMGRYMREIFIKERRMVFK